MRGKTLHYGSAIPGAFIVVATPSQSLCLLMHHQETGTGLLEEPSLETEEEMEFDWDMDIRGVRLGHGYTSALGRRWILCFWPWTCTATPGIRFGLLCPAPCTGPSSTPSWRARPGTRAFW
jgi:hypothetical protein